jgi:hypothetical protein
MSLEIIKELEETKAFLINDGHKDWAYSVLSIEKAIAKIKDYSRLDSLILEEKWSEVNAALLVNFLRMPIEHQKSLVEAMKERVPEVF